jgi:hypothetical protein
VGAVPLGVALTTVFPVVAVGAGLAGDTDACRSGRWRAADPGPSQRVPASNCRSALGIALGQAGPVSRVSNGGIQALAQQRDGAAFAAAAGVELLRARWNAVRAERDVARAQSRDRRLRRARRTIRAVSCWVCGWVALTRQAASMLSQAFALGGDSRLPSRICWPALAR